MKIITVCGIIVGVCLDKGKTYPHSAKLKKNNNGFLHYDFTESKGCL